jgi:hypothetical protein
MQGSETLRSNMLSPRSGSCVSSAGGWPTTRRVDESFTCCLRFAQRRAARSGQAHQLTPQRRAFLLPLQQLSMHSRRAGGTQSLQLGQACFGRSQLFLHD